MKDPPVCPQDPVADTEILYRALHNDPRLLPIDAQGRRRISSMAFNDARRRPSVDRAVLCPGGPAETQARFAPGSGVLSLVAGEVRQVTATHGITGQRYGVDVDPMPLPENPAHAEIFGRPPFDTDKLFDRIKQALARIATVAIPPECLAVAEAPDVAF
ncbi:MAG: hypothetical protein IT210_15985 [Armatimonadetes bacterium]|nr:hypothetical protein [Armatimonadota bacterium]